MTCRAVLSLKGPSRNGVVAAMSAELNAAIRSRGVAVAETDAMTLGPGEMAERIREVGADWVLAFGGYGADLRLPDGRSVYDACDCGFIGWDVDHPAYQYARNAAPIARRLRISASASQLRFAEDIGGPARDLAMLPGAPSPSKNTTALHERRYLACVAMAWLGEPDPWWRGARGTLAYRLVDGTVERVLGDELADLRRAFRASCADLGLEPKLDAPLCLALSQIVTFVRQYDRLKLATALAALKVPTALIGSGWAGRIAGATHLTHFDDGDIDWVQAIYRQSRIVLNINAANGACERALMALASGALVLSEPNPLLAATFAEAPAVAFYDRRRPETVGDRFSALLESDTADAAVAGLSVAIQDHDWRGRAAVLLKALAD